MDTNAPKVDRVCAGLITLRPVTPDDDEFLLRVYASTRAEELAVVPWSAEQKWAFIRSQSEAQRRQYEARFPDAQYSVVLHEGESVGRLWLARSGDEIRVLDIALLPEYRNRGIGARLLGDLVTESEAESIPLRLMVFQPNETARRFYLRLGFVEFEEVGMHSHLERRPSGTSPADATPRG